MYGEFLLEAGRLAEAADQFELALTRTPNRTKSVDGLAKSKPVQYGAAR
jgi:Tfp pilus assembly protein PilF